MAKPDGADKPQAVVEEPRRSYATRPVAAFMPALLRPAFRRRAPGTGPVLADWDTIVGPALAAVTTPRKLFSGTLTVVCAGPVAMELQYLSETLIGRINGHLGKVTVTRLRFVQDLAAVASRTPPIKPQAVEAARQAVADLPEGELRDALESLGRVVLTGR